MITMTASTMITMARPNMLSARTRASILPSFLGRIVVDVLLFLCLAEMRACYDTVGMTERTLLPLPYACIRRQYLA